MLSCRAFAMELILGIVAAEYLQDAIFLCDRLNYSSVADQASRFL